MQYDAAIIGAGADGLAAAAHLARAGATVVVIERGDSAGGRLTTRQFHPGFFASPFLDWVPAIPGAVLETLGGVALRDAAGVPDAVATRHDAACALLLAAAATPFSRNLLARLARRAAPPAAPWPGSDLATASLESWHNDEALPGRALDPALTGSALALLTLKRTEAVTGGLGALGAAFAAAASGTELRLGLEASEVLTDHGRACGVMLADGSRIAATAVISTLDLKQSFLSLFPWNVLPPAMIAQAGAFRLTGATARLLLALKAPLREDDAVVLAGDEHALASFRRGVIADNPPLRLDPVSARDSSLAPQGGGVATVTLGCMPYSLFDGGWTQNKRLALSAGTLARLDALRPGLSAGVLHVEVIAPPDIEAALGATQGDLDGGQLTPDQMLGLRPAIRTALPGFYLGGASTGAGPLGTGLAGLAAAMAVIADASPKGLQRWLP